jgi:hypothetical protein
MRVLRLDRLMARSLYEIESMHNMKSQIAIMPIRISCRFSSFLYPSVSSSALIRAHPWLLSLTTLVRT